MQQSASHGEHCSSSPQAVESIASSNPQLTVNSLPAHLVGQPLGQVALDLGHLRVLQRAALQQQLPRVRGCEAGEGGGCLGVCVCGRMHVRVGGWAGCR